MLLASKLQSSGDVVQEKAKKDKEAKAKADKALKAKQQKEKEAKAKIEKEKAAKEKVCTVYTSINRIVTVLCHTGSSYWVF